ncbi:MAG: VOC family protein [Acidobacteriota bacterium]|nr:VOC family protein [Acidobacteriota bacterium]
MPAIQRIVPILPVADIARAIDFYRRLGFVANRYQGSGGGGGYAFLSRDPFEIHITHVDGFSEGTSVCGVYFYLAPGSAASLEDEFRNAGVPILSPLAPRPWRMNEFVISDPDTNLLRFGEPA